MHSQVASGMRPVGMQGGKWHEVAMQLAEGWQVTGYSSMSCVVGVVA